MADTEFIVTAAIIRRGEKILIAQRGSGSLAGKWEFPGGKAEAGERLEDCLMRELREELGIEATVGQLFLVTTHDYGANGLVRLHAFLCRIVAGEPEPRYHSVLQWVSPADLSRYEFAPADIPIIAALTGAEDHTA